MVILVNKSWYKPKTIYAALAVALVAIVSEMGINLPTEILYPLLGAFGLYGVRDAVDGLKSKK